MFKDGEVVYVSHKYRDNPYENYLKVRLLVSNLSRVYPNVTFIAPHLYLPHFLDEDIERDKAMKYCLSLLSLCDTMVIFGKVSEGVQIEWNYTKEYMNRKGMKIKVKKADESLYKKLNVSMDLIEDD